MEKKRQVDIVYQRYLAGAKTKERLDALRAANSLQIELSVFEKAVANVDECQLQNDIYLILKQFQDIVDQYQEQPHLMDPHLESLLLKLLEIARNEKNPEPVVHLAFKLLYLITKTRGYKIIVRLMPHEVSDLEPVLKMLDMQSPDDFKTWETRYMLLLWLSMVSMIPFDMVRLDSNVAGQSGEKKQPIMQRIVDVGKLYLEVSDKCRDAAAYMLARFMTRPDVKKQQLPAVLDWILAKLSKADELTIADMSSVSGRIRTLALLFKQGKREDLVEYAPLVLKHVIGLNLPDCNNTLLRKLFCKLVQRLGLTFLKARVASWRYQRGSRSLADNLGQKGQAETGSGNKQLNTEEDEEYDIPDEIEEIIECLLNGLKDKDTVVRWSAAKGIGRVTGRLPKELADEVVGSIMELFSISETDGAWHGGCLALAELGRRGLLLPERLPDVIPVIFRALMYDEKRGNFSVGAHVRDAACYVCWAFARAYDPRELQQHITQIAISLLIVSVLDREVNVRRAASAAFQEHVGRQGKFPHGIDILTECDYFAVGNRNNCYLELSVFIAQFEEYTDSIIDHLVDVKTSHWDIAMRELTSQALGNLTDKAPEYMARKILPKLVKMSGDIDLNLRHGAITSAAQVTRALASLAWKENKCTEDLVDDHTLGELVDITPKLMKGQLLKGMGGEFMRKAVCCLIEKLSEAKLKLHESPIIATWQEIIDECLQHAELEVQMAAVSSVPAFFTQYYRLPDGGVIPQIQENIMEKYLHKLLDQVETVRMGYALAVGAFPKFFIQGKLKVILGALIRCSTITEKDQKFAEARRDAIRSIASVCITVGVNKAGPPTDCLCAQNVYEVYDCLFTAMKDYTLDSRGDVGACVREAAMTSLYDITDLIIRDEPSLFPVDVCRMIFCNLVQQSCEKIDRTRGHAGEIFGKLLHHNPPLPGIPHEEKLLELFPRDTIQEIFFGVPKVTFPMFTELLSEATYTYPVLLGMTVSVGGLTESLVKYSSMSLMTYVRNISEDQVKMTHFSDNLLQVFRDHQREDRVTLPMMKMLDQLLSNNCFSEESYQTENHIFSRTLFDLTKEEVTRCGEVQKLLASIDVFCGLLQFKGDVIKKTLFQLAVFHCHRFPIVRKTSAFKLYEAILTFDDVVPEENMDEVMTLLSETQWDRPIETVKPIRNQICDLLGINRPVAKAKATGAASNAAEREKNLPQIQA